MKKGITSSSAMRDGEPQLIKEGTKPARARQKKTPTKRGARGTEWYDDIQSHKTAVEHIMALLLLLLASPKQSSLFPLPRTLTCSYSPNHPMLCCRDSRGHRRGHPPPKNCTKQNGPQNH